MDMDSREVQSDQLQGNDEHNAASQQVTYGAEEHHSDHEKKSVLKKVKAKAKKIKDSIKKHGHHVLDRGHDNEEDQHSLDENELAEDEEMVKNSEVHHGAPSYESEVKNATPTTEEVENSEKSGIDYGRTSAMGEESHQNPSTVGVSPTTELDQNIITDPLKTFSGEEKTEQYNVNLDLVKSNSLEENPQAPEAYTSPNYQTKDTDHPSGGAGSDEIDMTPVEQSFGRMKLNVQDEPKATPEPNANRDPEVTLETRETFAPFTTKNEEQQKYESVESRPNQNSFTDKTSSAIADEVVSAKGDVASKLAYGEKGDAASKLGYEEKPGNVGAYSATEIDENIASESVKTFSEEEKQELCKVNFERLTRLEEDPHTQRSRTETYAPPVYQTKVTYPRGEGSDEIDITPVEESFGRMDVHDEPKPTSEPKSTVADTEYPSAESHEQFPPDKISTNINRNLEITIEPEQIFNTTTVEEQPKYESVETQSNQNSYTEKTSSAITEETLSAENSADSKLDHEEEKGDIHEEQPKNGNASNISGSTAESGKNIANSLTQKLAPVYEKVAGVGSAVKSKVYGTSTGAVGTETKNGVSVKEYLAEKLRPGEEDKALSEVISEALHKPKEDHNQKSSENVSEESSVNSPGKGVVDKLKGVVGSWFGKSEENQSSQVAVGGEDLSKNAKSGVIQTD